VTPDTIFLDIGANVGFYAVQIARRLAGEGKVYAFEPHPKLVELLRRNAHLNGLLRAVECLPFALSDRNASTNLQYPHGHLGGGRIAGPGELLGHTLVESETKRLDDVFGPKFACDLVKIDVEGHEINVLNGMLNIIQNSPKIKILFEKLLPNMGTEVRLEKYFKDNGFVLYGVQSDSSLLELNSGGLVNWGGYALAARRGVIDDGMDRSRFSIFAKQLWPRAGSESRLLTDRLRCRGSHGTLMFHGPYWFLKRGRWRLKFHGHIRGTVAFSILERFGYGVSQFTFDAGQSEHTFTLQRDLVHFECAAWATKEETEIAVERIDFIRVA
jgi:FkbM family methyltransferase